MKKRINIEFWGWSRFSSFFTSLTLVLVILITLCVFFAPKEGYQNAKQDPISDVLKDPQRMKRNKVLLRSNANKDSNNPLKHLDSNNVLNEYQTGEPTNNMLHNRKSAGPELSILASSTPTVILTDYSVTSHVKTAIQTETIQPKDSTTSTLDKTSSIYVDQFKSTVSLDTTRFTQTSLSHNSASLNKQIITDQHTSSTITTLNDPQTIPRAESIPTGKSTESASIRTKKVATSTTNLDFNDTTTSAVTSKTAQTRQELNTKINQTAETSLGTLMAERTFSPSTAEIWTVLPQQPVSTSPFTTNHESRSTSSVLSKQTVSTVTEQSSASSFQTSVAGSAAPSSAGLGTSPIMPSFTQPQTSPTSTINEPSSVNSAASYAFGTAATLSSSPAPNITSKMSHSPKPQSTATAIVSRTGLLLPTTVDYSTGTSQSTNSNTGYSSSRNTNPTEASTITDKISSSTTAETKTHSESTSVRSTSDSTSSSSMDGFTMSSSGTAETIMITTQQTQPTIPLMTNEMTSPLNTNQPKQTMSEVTDSASTSHTSVNSSAVPPTPNQQTQNAATTQKTSSDQVSSQSLHTSNPTNPPITTITTTNQPLTTKPLTPTRTESSKSQASTTLATSLTARTIHTPQSGSTQNSILTTTTTSSPLLTVKPNSESTVAVHQSSTVSSNKISSTQAIAATTSETTRKASEGPPVSLPSLSTSKGTLQSSDVTKRVTTEPTTPSCTECECNGGSCIYNKTLGSCQCQCHNSVFGNHCSYGENEVNAHFDTGLIPTQKTQFNLTINATYLDSFKNLSSPESRDVIGPLERELDIFCKEADPQTYKSVKIIKLLQGSVIANSEAEYNYPNNESKIHFVNTQLQAVLTGILNDTTNLQRISQALGSKKVELKGLIFHPPLIKGISDLETFVNCSRFANYTPEIINGQWQCVGHCKKDPNYCNPNKKCYNNIHKGPICIYYNTTGTTAQSEQTNQGTSAQPTSGGPLPLETTDSFTTSKTNPSGTTVMSSRETYSSAVSQETTKLFSSSGPKSTSDINITPMTNIQTTTLSPLLTTNRFTSANSVEETLSKMSTNAQQFTETTPGHSTVITLPSISTSKGSLASRVTPSNMISSTEKSPFTSRTVATASETTQSTEPASLLTKTSEMSSTNQNIKISSMSSITTQIAKSSPEQNTEATAPNTGRTQGTSIVQETYPPMTLSSTQAQSTSATVTSLTTTTTQSALPHTTNSMTPSTLNRHSQGTFSTAFTELSATSVTTLTPKTTHSNTKPQTHPTDSLVTISSKTLQQTISHEPSATQVSKSTTALSSTYNDGTSSKTTLIKESTMLWTTNGTTSSTKTDYSRSTITSVTTHITSTKRTPNTEILPTSTQKSQESASSQVTLKTTIPLTTKLQSTLVTDETLTKVSQSSESASPLTKTSVTTSPNTGPSSSTINTKITETSPRNQTSFETMITSTSQTLSPSKSRETPPQTESALPQTSTSLTSSPTVDASTRTFFTPFTEHQTTSGGLLSLETTKMFTTSKINPSGTTVKPLTETSEATSIRTDYPSNTTLFPPTTKESRTSSSFSSVITESQSETKVSLTMSSKTKATAKQTFSTVPFPTVFTKETSTPLQTPTLMSTLLTSKTDQTTQRLTGNSSTASSNQNSTAEFTSDATTKEISQNSRETFLPSLSFSTSTTPLLSNTSSPVTASPTTPNCAGCQCILGSCAFNETLGSCQCQCQEFVFGDQCAYGINDALANIDAEETPTRKANITLMINTTYDNALKNMSSRESIDFIKKLEKQLGPLCEQADKDSYQSVKVIELIPGSVIAKTVAEYNYLNNESQIQFVNTQLKEVLADILNDPKSLNEISLAFGNVPVEVNNISFQTPSINNITELEPFINCSFANYTPEIINGQWQCEGYCKRDPNYCNQHGQCYNEISQGPLCICYENNLEHYYGPQCDLFRRGAGFYAALFGSLAGALLLLIFITTVITVIIRRRHQGFWKRSYSFDQ